ncbi:MAG: NifB/NifX family molybdenum-iron cluster-binding protein [Clostridia bacterium]|nr:NifB/NifX family molybdenum-iron cluster-binding protein [Clostridia bacterium]
MIIAVGTENGVVYPHFGKAPEYTAYAIEDGKIVSKETISSPGHGVCGMPAFMQEHRVEVVIAGGIGQGAIENLIVRGIEVVAGASGNADQVVQAYLRGSLATSPQTCGCGGHGHDHAHEGRHDHCHEHGHADGGCCGDHGHEHGHVLGHENEEGKTM